MRLEQQPPPCTTQVRGDCQLQNLAKLSRCLIGLIDAFYKPTIDALDAEGCHAGHTSALRAELVRVAVCAERAKGRGRVLPT
jgi:hypothetical protein